MDKKEALAALRDIHVPPPIGGWPWAPGWYLVLACGLTMIGVALLLVYRHYSNGRAKRAALCLLAQYQAQHQQAPNSQRTTALISELLRRVALAYHRRTHVAGLMGDAWIDFLNSTVAGVNFNGVERLLLELPYQSPQSCELGPLFDITRQWIKGQGRPCLN